MHATVKVWVNLFNYKTKTNEGTDIQAVCQSVVKQLENIEAKMLPFLSASLVVSHLKWNRRRLGANRTVYALHKFGQSLTNSINLSIYRLAKLITQSIISDTDGLEEKRGRKNKKRKWKMTWLICMSRWQSKWWSRAADFDNDLHF